MFQKGSTGFLQGKCDETPTLINKRSIQKVFRRTLIFGSTKRSNFMFDIITKLKRCRNSVL